MNELDATKLKKHDLLGAVFINKIKKHLAADGYLLLRNWSHIFTNPADDLIDFCSLLGTLVPHNGSGEIIWDIKNRQNQESIVATFSEHNEAAGFHTDSQYRLNPENVFCLYCIARADCGGGLSGLLSLKDIMAELNRSDDGKSVVEVLKKEKFRFLVPSVFSVENHISFTEALIFEKGSIRFRMDTLDRALQLFPQFNTPKGIEAYLCLKHIIKTANTSLQFELRDGDLIFVNNKTMLHSRSAFTDNKRHLLRVRLNMEVR